MAARRPPGALEQAAGMIAAADDNPAGRGLLLEMALEAEILIALHQHPLVDGAVNGVAGRATLAHRLVLEYERTSLRSMASAAGVKFGGQRSAAALDHLSLVRVVTIGATDLPFQNRMMIREIELAALVQMALEAGLGGILRVHDRAGLAAGLDVERCRAMARLALNAGQPLGEAQT